ncbi:hypothetical protein N6P31_09840 [Pectobacterium betavasculorum]|uniref:hypothetical protein n=1 Tax=Pectobacterium betavasculorum TaxID=55207 RepID=UPI00313E77D8
MNLEIRFVKGHGDLNDERIVLKALADVNVGKYIVSDTTYHSDDEVSNKLRHIYWIPDKDVEKDDLVVIYTRKGNDKTVNNNSGNRTHFFYWGLECPVWNQKEDAAVLFSLNAWSSKKV